MSETHLTLAEAAKRSGLSRRTIARKIEAGVIEAERDASGAWRIAPTALLAAGVPLDAPAPPDPVPVVSDTALIELRAELAAAKARADAAERARDQAEQYAQTLAEVVRNLSRGLPPAPAPVAEPVAPAPPAPVAPAAPERRRWWQRG